MAIKVSKNNIIYKFSSKNSPVKRIESGEIVEFETIDAFSGQINSENSSAAKLDFDNLNAATGPVYIEKAKPGETLKIEILEINLNNLGYQSIVPGFGLLKDQERFKEPVTKRCEVKDDKVYLENDFVFNIRPNIGTIGVAPKNNKEISSIIPGEHGGNLDTKEITEDSTLYLPIFVKGALFALGDVHALQGDGEVCGTSVEIGANVKVKLTVIDENLERPLLITEDQIITLASAETLDEAAYLATNDMVNLISNNNLEPVEAYTYLTLNGDIRVSQTVNPLKTVKMITRKSKYLTLDDKF
ncbi:MAG: acetamidase/formamidase family protein [Halanaerobiales bacterium]